MAIYEYSRSYAFISGLIRCAFRMAYRRLEYIGLERIPRNAAIIFTPNHCNALMDALAVLFMDHQYKVFVSRADIFRRPRIAAILRWLRIMPIRRVRDGLDEVRQNDATIREAVDTLRHGVPFCIMVEGTHHPERTLLPLKKGVFRIALQAHEQLGDAMPVYIVPVRLEFHDLYHLWDTLRISIGNPLPVTGEFCPTNINRLLEDLTQRMSAQLVPQPWGDDWMWHDQWVKRQSVGERILRCTLLILTAPLATVCALLTTPIWLGELIIRNTVEDRCFHTSLLFIWAMVWILLSLLTLYLPWIALEEWRYHARILLNKK